MRTSTGAIVAPDFSSVPQLTNSERALIRSYVGLKQVGRTVAPEALLEPSDGDSIWVGGDAYTTKISRLVGLRDQAVDSDLKDCLSVKLHCMQQAWSQRGSASSTRLLVDDAAPFTLRSSCLWRQVHSWSEKHAPVQQGTSQPSASAPIAEAGAADACTSARVDHSLSQGSAADTSGAMATTPVACAAADAVIDCALPSAVPDTPDDSAEPQGRIPVTPIALGDSDDEVCCSALCGAHLVQAQTACLFSLAPPTCCSHPGNMPWFCPLLARTLPVSRL